MIKVIVSHDVDHLYRGDHWFRDFIYPKLFVRSSIQMVRRRITIKEWWLRNVSCFQKNRNHIREVMDFDREYGVPSAFFFGVSRGLGMSYKPKEAAETVKWVRDQGFLVGLHGICYDSYDGIKAEYDTFVRAYGLEPCGIRMHYVRYDDKTFENEARVGYPFDTTEFEKEKNGTQKNPYKVGDMWEFPLTIMDGYLPQNIDEAKRETLKKLQECRDKHMEYVTVLFHDYQFCDAYKDMRAWYTWLIQYFKDSPEYCFISYEEAMKELVSG